MSGINMVGGHPVGGPSGLGADLLALSERADRAARLTAGDYLHDPSKLELQRAFKDAQRTIARVEVLMPAIAAHGGGEDGVRLAQAAVSNLTAGQGALKAGVSIEDELLRSGALVADPLATGTAGGLFKEAAAALRGAADIANFRGMTDTAFDDAIRMLGKLR